MHVRPATVEDAAAIGTVHALSRSAAYDGLVPAAALARVTPATQAEVWRARLTAARPPYATFVAEHGDVVVGFTHGHGRGTTAELDALHLLPDHHGSGAGQALHDALLDAFAGWGCTEAELWVLHGNERAQSFYRRNGWVHDGTTGEHEVGGVVVPIRRYARPVRSC